MMRFVPLDYDLAQTFGDKILECSRDISDWNLENFLCEIPGKWQLSFLAMKDEEIIGYAIVSAKFGNPHLHHLMIRKDWRSRGIGRAMICRMIELHSCFSLKVHKSNVRAIKFYKKNRLVITDDAGDYIWMESHDPVHAE